MWTQASSPVRQRHRRWDGRRRTRQASPDDRAFPLPRGGELDPRTSGTLAPTLQFGIMFSLLKRALWLSICLAMIVPASAHQILPGQQSTPTNATTPKNGTPADPLGRDTPSGTLYGFLQAAQSGNYSIADQYLQLSPARRQTQGEDIASKLKVVIDRSFSGDLRRISNQPEGTPQEGVPLDKQRVGNLNSGDVDADLVLTRVSDSSGTRIWLISSETLARVPELYEQAAVHQVETHLPQALVRNEFLGIPWWQWLAILIAIPVAALLGWVAVQILRLPWYFWARYRKHGIAEAWISFVRPLWLVLGVLAHGILVSYIRIPVLQRHRYQQVAGVAAIIGANWLLWRVLRGNDAQRAAACRAFRPNGNGIADDPGRARAQGRDHRSGHFCHPRHAAVST